MRISSSNVHKQMLSVVIQVLRYKYNNVRMQNPENYDTYNSDVRN